MARLYLEDDAGNVRIVPMEADEVSIGRAEDNHIVLPDRNVSRHHARLRAVNGRFFVEDAGARYGLFLNGSRVDGRREVRSGDLIGLGDYKIKVLPGEGWAEVEAAEPAPDRRETVPAIPAMAEPEDGREAFSDTSILSLRDMERVARRGWRSDFEGRDEVAQSLTRRIIVLGVLAAVAALLVWAYLWVTSPTEVETSVPAPVRIAEPVLEPIEPAPIPAPPPLAVAPAVEAPPPPGVEKPVVEAPKPVAPPAPPPRSAGEAKRETPRAQEPRQVAVAEPRAPARPAPPPAPAVAKPAAFGTGDAMEVIEAAIQEGRLGEAEGLLAKCRGSACADAWKKVGDRYQAGGQPRKAIAAYEKARAMTGNAVLKSRLEQKIKAIQGGL